MLITTRRNQEDISSLVSHSAVEKKSNTKTFISFCVCYEANRSLSQEKKHCKSKPKAARGARNPVTISFPKFSAGILSATLKLGKRQLTWSFLKYKMQTLFFSRLWDWMTYIPTSSQVVLMLLLLGKDAALRNRPQACQSLLFVSIGLLPCLIS